MDIFKASELIDYTLKKKKPQRVFKNASLVMVQTEEIIRADLAINDGIIVGIGD